MKTVQSIRCVLLATIVLNAAVLVSPFSPSPFVVLSGPFNLPKFELPSWFPNSDASPGSTTTTAAAAAAAAASADKPNLNPGDKIVIFGGTGGVGQLVTKKLKSQGFELRIAARDTQKADEAIGDPTVETVPLNLVMDFEQDDLDKALEGASAAIISLGTTAFPTLQWRNGNTPPAIDRDAVTKIAQAASNVQSLKKVVLITSVGVRRTDQMPFPILNLFGVLDCKRDGEDALIAASKQGTGFDYVVLRPGRLVGGPYTNTDFVKLLQIEGGKCCSTLNVLYCTLLYSTVFKFNMNT